jgi:hypothetical protein
MTNQVTRNSYQAVRCLYCSEPIPLSSRLLELFVVESESTIAKLQGESQVFILRCKVCSKENRYLKAEIETFESESAPNTRPEPILGVHQRLTARPQVYKLRL